MVMVFSLLSTTKYNEPVAAGLWLYTASGKKEKNNRRTNGILRHFD
jgi:hypothetical protein